MVHAKKPEWKRFWLPSERARSLLPRENRIDSKPGKVSMRNEIHFECPRCKQVVTPKLGLNRKGNKPEKLYCPSCGRTIKDFYNAWPGAIAIFVVLAILAYLRFGQP